MEDDHYSPSETVRRREAALKRMLSTPPSRHRDSKPSRKRKVKVRSAKPAKGEA